MAPPDDLTRLRHIIESARKAVRFSSGRQMSDFEKDELLNLALVQLLEIIGEAASGISEGMREKYPDVAWREMSATRNRLIHAYFEINYDVVWNTVTQELPPLIIQLEKILEKEEPQNRGRLSQD